MGSGASDMCSQIRFQTILFSGFLCAFQILLFIYWVRDKYMTVTALLHCIAAILVIIGALTLFCLYLPHMVNHLLSTTKPRKTAAIMILIGGILHFIAGILAISNPLYCNYMLCEIHIFVFMIAPFCITLVLFLDEFYLIFYRKIRFRIVIYSLILFISGLLFIPYYATTKQENILNQMTPTQLMVVLYQIIWIIILITSCILIICVGCQHKKVISDYKHTLSASRSFSDSNPYNNENITPGNFEKDHSKCCCFCCACLMNESNRKTLILINSLLVILAGSATLISSYFYLDDKRYDVIVCYHCLVVLISWFIGIDSIYYYKDTQYEAIQNPVYENEANNTHNSHNPNNPFGENENEIEDEMENNNHCNDRVIIEQNDLDYNSNNNNAWNIPPSSSVIEDDDPLNDFSSRARAYD